MSAGRGTRLSRKRKNDTDLQFLSGTSSHDIPDDFQDATTVFRIPKKLKTKNFSGSLRPRGRPRRSGTKDSTVSDLPSDKGKENPELLDEESRDFVDQAYDPCLESESQGLDSEDGVKENIFLIDLEKSICSESEKICPCCKHIVPSAVLTDHFKECLQKFKMTKGGCKRKSTANTSTVAKEEENEGKMEIEGKSDESLVLLCPVCMKTFRSKTQCHSHVKICAKSHGLSLEQLLLASKLLEKQVEERKEFGLPLPLQQTHGNRDQAVEKITAGNEKRNTKVSIRTAKKDPDLVMAMALSRSMAEEEVTARVKREEKLLTLGLDQIVDEERKAQPILFPFPEADSKKKSTSQSRNKRQKHRDHLQNTALAMCSVEERERRISEKVAEILAADDTPRDTWQITDVSGGKGHLSEYKNEACRLWEAAHSCTDQPLEGFYVPELEPYIKPKETTVGGLLRRLSQIPGRLNVTAIHAMDEENSDSGSDCEETSVIDGYCTQFALAELLGSQECLDFTLAHGSSEDQNMPQGFDSITDPNSTLEAGSGFWFVHPADQEIDENPENRKSKPTAAYLRETQVMDNSGSSAGSNRNDSNDYDKTTENIVKDRLGRVIFKENSESTNNYVNINSDSKSEIVSINLGDQEDCIKLDENMVRLDSGKDRSFLENPSNETRISFNISKSGYPHSCNTVESKDQERDVVKAVVVTDKCQEDSSKYIDKTPERNLTHYKDKINEYVSECKDRNSVDCEVTVTLNNISEKLLDYNLEKMPTGASDLSSVSDSSKIQFSPKVYNPSSSEQLVTSDQGIKDNTFDEKSNFCGHSVESDATQNLEDDEKCICRLNPIGKSLTEKTLLSSDSELLSSDIDDSSKQKEEGRKKEQRHGSFTLYNSLGKDFESHLSFTQGIMQHLQHEHNIEVDIMTLQSKDHCEQSQSSIHCRPIPQLMDRNCDDKRILSVRDTSSNPNETREYCEEKVFLRKTHSVAIEELRKQPKAELEVNDNLEEAEFPQLSQTKSELRDGCLKNGRFPQENQTECEELKPMQEKLQYDWSMLLTSEEESDVIIMTAKSRSILAHSLVFLARCPKLYKEVKDAKMQITWDKVSYEGAYVFLMYLYTGTCKIKAKDDPLWLDVFDLALQYNCKDLVSYLESLYKVHSTPIKKNSLTKNKRNSKVMDDLLNIDHASHLIRRRLASVQGNIEESERPVKRCLNMSTIGGKNMSDSSTSPVDGDTLKNSQCGNNYKKIAIEANLSSKNSQEEGLIESQNEQRSQSPDLFDETVPVKDISFISTPSNLPPSLTIPNQSPWEESAYAMHCEPNTGIFSVVSSKETFVTKYVGSQKVSKYDVKALLVESPHVHSPISHKSEEKSNAKPVGEKMFLQCSRTNDVSKQSGGSSGIEDHFDHEIRSITSLKVDGQNHGTDSPEIKDDVIDLTLSSSDNSIGTESLTGELANSPSLDLNAEEMDPLKLCSTENSPRAVGDGNQQELTMAGDSISSHTKNLTENISFDKELECVDEHYISKVWDGFDDVGSSVSVPIDIYPTPEKYLKKTSADGCIINDSTVSGLSPVKGKDGSLATITRTDACNTIGSEPKLAFSALSRQYSIKETSASLCSDEDDFGVSNTNKFMASLEQVETVFKDENEVTSVPSCSDDTLVKLTAELDDSGIRKEFEEEIEVCKQRPQKRQALEIIHEPLPQLMTPQGKSTGDNKAVTPMPDYKTMSSSTLKKELQKYGIRPISRQKALVLLEHMYEQTHPYVTDSEAESSFLETPQHKKTTSKHASMHEKVITKSKKFLHAAEGSKNKKTDVKSKDKVIKASTTVIKDTDKEIVDKSSQLHSSQSSVTSTDGSEYDCLEESLTLEMDEDDIFTPTQQADLRSLVKQFITSDPELHQRVLLYEPIFVEELLSSLKTNGVRCSMKNLLDILDDQCITFRTQQGQRNRARTRRSPKKRKAQSPNKNRKAQTR